MPLARQGQRPHIPIAEAATDSQTSDSSSETFCPAGPSYHVNRRKPQA